ncbi:MAG: ATP-binding cassette domain-containing protein [Ruminococcus sp.]|nr:ATP-binding cassette domain-containing protein [Ruminococcus sp.]
MMSHIAGLPIGFIGEMGSGKIRRIVNDSSSATETYLAHQLPDMAGAIATPHFILDMKPLPDTVKSEKPKDNSVEFKNVSFRYSKSETDALKNVSFKVQSGETIALVGLSGGGKTTVAGLISRFWDFFAGEIKVGNVNMKNIKKSELTETISYVFQDSSVNSKFFLPF